MEQAGFSPFPHLSWLGAWTAVGEKPAMVEVHLRQVNHCLIYSAGSGARVRWIHRGREERFAVEPGTVRFSPADDDSHTLIGRCEPGHRFYTLLVPRRHLVETAEAEGIAAVPDLEHSVSRRDSVLTVCMRTLASDAPHAQLPSAEEQEAAGLALLLRLMAMNGYRGPDWRNDNSVFERRTLTHLVDYIDDHLGTAPSLGDMSLLVGMSPSHFAKKFRRSTGLSLHRFTNQRRIRRALAVLQGCTSPLAVVARDLGFSSHSHFTRTFTKTTGLTPTTYQEQFQRVVG